MSIKKKKKQQCWYSLLAKFNFKGNQITNRIKILIAIMIINEAPLGDT